MLSVILKTNKLNMEFNNTNTDDLVDILLTLTEKDYVLNVLIEDFLIIIDVNNVPLHELFDVILFKKNVKKTLTS